MLFAVSLLSLLLCSQAWAASYEVQTGDCLQSISDETGVGVSTLKALNNLQGDFLAAGQVLQIGNNPIVPNVYTVKEGDTQEAIAERYGITVDGIRKLNNLEDERLYIDQTLVLEGLQASRGGARYGELVDWFSEGKYLLTSGLKFTAVDIQTGTVIDFVVHSSGNHCDIETATQADTDAMWALFGGWVWEPRPVCINVNGRYIAASLSGMPHSNIENIRTNGVTGHIDMYLYQSGPHGDWVSKRYVQRHHDAVWTAAGN